MVRNRYLLHQFIPSSTDKWSYYKPRDVRL